MSSRIKPSAQVRVPYFTKSNYNRFNKNIFKPGLSSTSSVVVVVVVVAGGIGIDVAMA